MKYDAAADDVDVDVVVDDSNFHRAWSSATVPSTTSSRLRSEHMLDAACELFDAATLGVHSPGPNTLTGRSPNSPGIRVKRTSGGEAV